MTVEIVAGLAFLLGLVLGLLLRGSKEAEGPRTQTPDCWEAWALKDAAAKCTVRQHQAYWLLQARELGGHGLLPFEAAAIMERTEAQVLADAWFFAATISAHRSGHAWCKLPTRAVEGATSPR